MAKKKKEKIDLRAHGAAAGQRFSIAAQKAAERALKKTVGDLTSLVEPHDTDGLVELLIGFVSGLGLPNEVQLSMFRTMPMWASRPDGDELRVEAERRLIETWGDRPTTVQ